MRGRNKASRGGVAHAACIKDLSLPARLNSAQRPDEKVKWAGLPPNRTKSDRSGPEAASPNRRPPTPGSRADCRGDSKIEQRPAGMLAPSLPVFSRAGGGAPSSPPGTRQPSSALAARRALANESARVNFGDALTGGSGPLQGFTTDAFGTPVTSFCPLDPVSMPCVPPATP